MGQTLNKENDEGVSTLLAGIVYSCLHSVPKFSKLTLKLLVKTQRFPNGTQLCNS